MPRRSREVSLQVILIAFGLGQGRAEALGFPRAGRLFSLAKRPGLLDFLDRGLGVLGHRPGLIQLLVAGVRIAGAECGEQLHMRRLALTAREIRVAPVLDELQALRTVAGRLGTDRLQRRLDLPGLLNESDNTFDPALQTLGPSLKLFQDGFGS